MENKSIVKKINADKIYSVIGVVENRSLPDNYVTLDRSSAILKAYGMYYDGKDVISHYDVFIDTWKNGIIVKTEYMDNNEKLVVGYENQDV